MSIQKPNSEVHLVITQPFAKVDTLIGSQVVVLHQDQEKSVMINEFPIAFVNAESEVFDSSACLPFDEHRLSGGQINSTRPVC